MSVRGEWNVEEALGAFDEHLRRARGLCAGTRGNYTRWVGAFLATVFPDGRVAVEQIDVSEVSDYVDAAARRYQPRTVESVATSLRSFCRFLRAAGLRTDHLEDAVPIVPHRGRGLARHLDPESFERLITSLDSDSPRGLRDRAIILCIARLGLRSSEVTRLRLEDIDWHQAVVRVRSRKTGHGARLPLTEQVGAALADYLEHGRPATRSRQVFVLHRLRVGEPISESIVTRGVDHALARAGIDAPVRGANLLRHSLATGLLAHGAGLVQIADVMGHRRLATTQIYAAVDVTALRQAAMPWPGAAS